jgi:hypothetical protein
MLCLEAGSVIAKEGVADEWGKGFGGYGEGRIRYYVGWCTGGMAG